MRTLKTPIEGVKNDMENLVIDEMIFYGIERKSKTQKADSK